MQTNPKPLPELNFVAAYLRYDPGTGLLYWRVSSGKAKAGAVAGCEQNGYILIGIGGRLMKAHRLAWLLHHGRDPIGIVDHINGKRSDNRICNLREASHTQNMHNRRTDKDNKSGVKGVCWNKWKSKWMAYLGGKHLGYFAEQQDAESAVKAAREAVHGTFTCHGV